jgi:two-component system, NtrC family, response regulator
LEKPPTAFLGIDSKIKAILELVALVADTAATVLIQGESGTGKELIARLIHSQSSRRDAAFVAVNCGAVAESLLESEMFGHTRGAFTGADAPKVGKFEAAQGGTIFLDELAEMSRPLQVALLRILQSGEFTPVGTAESRFTDARVITATNRELTPLIESGGFRNDLYYRLNIIRIELPSLRERRGDIPLLIDHFLHVLGSAYGKSNLSVGVDAEELLLNYSYPGNVRELENIIRRAVILCRGNTIRAGNLPSEVADGHSRTPARPAARYHESKEQALRDFDKAYLIGALSETGGIVSRAARMTGLSERNFHKKLARYHIDFRSFRR